MMYRMFWGHDGDAEEVVRAEVGILEIFLAEGFLRLLRRLSRVAAATHILFPSSSFESKRFINPSP